MEIIKKINVTDPIYIQIYNYYRELISSGVLKAETKLPSIRKCALDRMVSKTTVEAAYLQLSAEGYIIPKAGSGFYVCNIDYNNIKKPDIAKSTKAENKKNHLYDFVNYSIDSKGFDFKLWARYVKSALRNKERLIYYGDARGEYDLRSAICKYISEYRGVICAPEQIIVGAGVQSLLQILCSLKGISSPVVFIGTDFVKGKIVFRDRGFNTVFLKNLSGDFSGLEKINPKIIYISPSHITPSGDVMQIKSRLSLLSYAKSHGCLIIEDDYDSEFRYYTRPVPSLQSLDGGLNVVYMGTFSRLLLPSLRISFMVLPVGLIDEYAKHENEYNQTVSITEQIALCQFIRDGHLSKQIKKARKLFIAKSSLFCEAVKKVFKDKAEAIPGLGGFLIQLEVKTDKPSIELAKKAAEYGILLKPVEIPGEAKYPRVLMCISGVQENDFEKVLNMLNNAFFNN